MYDTDAAAPSRSGQAIRKDMPLTAEIRDSVQDNLSTANRIYNTLFELRDRIHGAGPANPANATRERGDPGHFAGMMRDLNGDLSERLSAIESLAQDFANRL